MTLIISLIIFIVSLGGIIFIIARHYTDLVIINPETIKKPEAEVRKGQIIEERMRRFWRDKSFLITRTWRWFLRFAQPHAHTAWSKLLEIERTLEKTVSRVSGTIIAKREKVNEFVEAGYKELANGNLPVAEGKFIDAIRIDPRAPEVYKGLAEVYVAKKSFREAEESLEFAAKLTPHDVSIYRALVAIAEATEERVKLLEYLSRIVELEPSNPKHLDLLIENAIMLGNKRLARQGLDRLGNVNSENKKIEEFDVRIRALG